MIDLEAETKLTPEERRLVRGAQKAAKANAERDELIAQAAEAQALTVRRIAELVGISHTAVIMIREAHRRGEGRQPQIKRRTRRTRAQEAAAGG